jgi:hypothetical protein
MTTDLASIGKTHCRLELRFASQQIAVDKRDFASLIFRWSVYVVDDDPFRLGLTSPATPRLR